MARTKQTAADYIERHDDEMRVILGERGEHATKINMCGHSPSTRRANTPSEP